MADTSKTYVSDGSSTIYTFEFDYILKDFVKVIIDGVYTSDFTLTDTYQLTLDNAPLAGAVIVINRETTPDRIVTFVDGSVLIAKDLNLSALQAIHIAEEAYDRASGSLLIDDSGAFSAGGRRISSVGEPTNDDDVATKGWVLGTGDTFVQDMQAILDEVTGIKPKMFRLPYGSDGFVEYDPVTGDFNLYLSEGPQGPQGEQGAAGTTGPQGSAGPQGAQGIQGIQGPKGDQGDRGQQGAQGPMGPIGPRGEQGLEGPQGLQGPAGLQGPTGPQGIEGPVGPQGVQGEAGPQGPAGEAGPTGPQGPEGDEGPVGATGPQGPQGEQGIEGPTGARGPIGPAGPTGPQGLQGEAGDTGPQGPEGEQGPTGATGPQGPQGLQGIAGPAGPQGVQGEQGLKGDKGDKGDPGDTGDKGPTGDQGPMGSTPLGLAFGRFYMNDDGELLIEYYGDADDNDFSIDADGFLHVTLT